MPNVFSHFLYNHKTAMRSSYLYNGNSYTGKKKYLYWDTTPCLKLEYPCACKCPHGWQCFDAAAAAKHNDVETKWPTFARRHFQIYFLEWKCLKFELTELCSYGPDWLWYSIGSDNGLAPIRRRAIMWTSDGLRWWHIYASLGLNDLRVTSLVKNILIVR